MALEDRVPIYLDTKYWIILRDALAGRTGAPEADILRRLRNAVAENKIFCPISETIFIELMKQRDGRTRLNMAALIDELSLGVTIIPSRERMGTELAHFIHTHGRGNSGLHPLRHLVWSKLGFVLGFMFPTATPFDAATELAVQKGFFDRMWAISLKEMVEYLGEEWPAEDSEVTDLAHKLNLGIVSYADELRSFRRAYAAELAGVIDLCIETVMEIVADMWEKSGEASVETHSPTHDELRQQWKNLLFHALQKGPARQHLRWMHIQASLHAALRWDKSRRFKPNDLPDFEHACVALAHPPYPVEAG